ncbi:MAG: hypothetical protein ACE5DX_03655 [Candidatus Dojkabacteria bacterium]
MANQSSSPSLRQYQDLESQTSGNRTFLILIVIILVAILGLVGFQILRGGSGPADTTEETQNQDDTTDDTPSPTPTDEEDPDTTDNNDIVEDGSDTGDQAFVFDSELPAGWKKVDLGLGYTIYRPGNWWFRNFGGTLGLDPNEIPEASEYAGMITMSKISGSMTSAISTYKSSLDTNVNEFNAVAGDNDWVIVTGKIDETMESEAKQVKSGFIQGGGQVYQLEYRVPPSQFAANENVFDTLLGVIEL